MSVYCTTLAAFDSHRADLRKMIAEDQRPPKDIVAWERSFEFFRPADEDAGQVSLGVLIAAHEPHLLWKPALYEWTRSAVRGLLDFPDGSLRGQGENLRSVLMRAILLKYGFYACRGWITVWPGSYRRQVSGIILAHLREAPLRDVGYFLAGHPQEARSPGDEVEVLRACVEPRHIDPVWALCAVRAPALLLEVKGLSRQHYDTAVKTLSPQ
jgi:hypothetical protein